MWKSCLEISPLQALSCTQYVSKVRQSVSRSTICVSCDTFSALTPSVHHDIKHRCMYFSIRFLVCSPTPACILHRYPLTRRDVFLMLSRYDIDCLTTDNSVSACKSPYQWSFMTTSCLSAGLEATSRCLLGLLLLSWSSLLPKWVFHVQFGTVPNWEAFC